MILAVEDAGTVNVFVICLDRAECDHKIIDGEFARQLATAARKGEIDRFSGDIQREEKGKSTFLTN